jgi:hypothetical protein
LHIDLCFQIKASFELSNPTQSNQNEKRRIISTLCLSLVSRRIQVTEYPRLRTWALPA